MSRIAVMVTRPCHIGGKAHAAGALLKLDALDAAQAVASGRAVLEHADDAVALREAIDKDTQRVLRLERQPAALPAHNPNWMRF
ncbi:MAG: hypothetical protein MUC86_13975 [Burkholderiaceae bacterium]|jgi:hypothetical protein|nr:hypothetical protein [Burkholderiaceae bacterium]